MGEQLTTEKFEISTPVRGNGDEAEELLSGPIGTEDFRRLSPDNDAQMAEEEIVLESRPGSSTDVQMRPVLEPRGQAQVRGREVVSPASPKTKRSKPTTQARLAVESRTPAVVRELEMGDDDGMMGIDKKARTSESLPNEPRHALEGFTSKSFDEHLTGMDVKCDSPEQQIYSCVANGKLYREDEIEVLAAICKGVDVTEIFSPERVTKLCRKYGLIAGDSFDLRDGYDLSVEQTQALVIDRIRRTKPTLVIGSPPCTFFSRLQKLNLYVHGPEWAARYEVEKKKAAKHIAFCLKVFELQRSRGAYFLLEHPESANSWDIPELVEFRRLDGVMTQVADQCMYGLTTHSDVKGESLPAKKPTRFMSNSWCVLQELSVRCDKSHVHQPLVGGRAHKAQEYPSGLCKAICRGISNQKRYDESGRVCTGKLEISSLQALVMSVNEETEKTAQISVGGLSMPGTVPPSGKPEPWRKPCKNNQYPSHWRDHKHEADGTARNFIETGGEENVVGVLTTGVNVGAEVLQREMDSIVEKHAGYVECWDDVTGAPLIEKLLRAARDLEMEFFESMGVWSERLPKEVAKERGGKIIQGRWVDTNKGDPPHPTTVRGL